MTIPTHRLASGFDIPLLGLGTWPMKGPTLVNAVRLALDMGYRHIDTADTYENQSEIGEALEGRDRAALFLTSKAYQNGVTYAGALRTCEKALRQLRTEYLDLFLIHWPNPDVPLADTLRAFEELHAAGKVRSIGVSNFSIRLLREAMGTTALPISTNQVEFHPLLYQRNLLAFCSAQGIPLTAYCPLARGEVLESPVIRAVAERQSKTPAQVALRWLLQKGLIVIPKTSSEARLRENMGIFDWTLPPEEIERIDCIGQMRRLIAVAEVDD